MKKERLAMLSVDWDYFVPEPIVGDMGHRENLFFLKEIWKARGLTVEDMPAIGWEKFWNTSLLWGPARAEQVFVSDSHLLALQVLRIYPEVSTVVLVDAHHDLWNTSPIDCSSWLRAWLEESAERTAYWIQADWSKGWYSLKGLPKSLKGRVYTVEHLPPHLDLGVCHICRSGCWTPPWRDREFISFVQNSGMDPISLQRGEWDGMRERWSAQDKKAWAKLNQKMERFKEVMKNGNQIR